MDALELTVRNELNLIFLVDTSDSMHGERINQLNEAMVRMLLAAKQTALEKEVDLKLRVVEVNTTARWLYGSTESGVDHIDWKDLEAGGSTDTAGAIDLARTVMRRSILGPRNYEPVVILITDGMSNEPAKTAEAIERLKMSLRSTLYPDREKVFRIAVSVQDADLEELERFASVGTLEHADGTVERDVPLVLQAEDLEMLGAIIRITVISMIGSDRPDVEFDSQESPTIMIQDDVWD